MVPAGKRRGIFLLKTLRMVYIIYTKGCDEMEKYIPYAKLSKKKKRERDSLQRKTWGDVKPVTRKAANAKIYNRKKDQRRYDEYGNADLFYRIKTSGNG